MKVLKWVGGFLVLVVLVGSSAGAVSKYLITSPNQIKPATITSADLNPSVSPLTYNFSNITFPVYAYGCGGGQWATVTANVSYSISLDVTGIYEVRTVESGRWSRAVGGVPGSPCNASPDSFTGGSFTGIQTQYVQPYSFNQGVLCPANCTYAQFIKTMFNQPLATATAYQFVFSAGIYSYTDINGNLQGSV